MFKHKPAIFAIMLAVVMLFGAVGCTDGDIQAIQGTLQNIDSVSGNLTVKLKDGTTQTFNFTDVKVDTIRQTLGGASLEIGDQVTIKVHKNGDVAKIYAEKAEVYGVIKRLGANDIALTTRHNGDITLNVTSDTAIKIEDRGTATFADLRIGQKVDVKYDVDTKNTLRIYVYDEEKDDGEVQGTIKEVNTTDKTVTVSAPRSGDITLNVTSNTAIRIQNRNTVIATLPDLDAGQKVEARYDTGTRIVSRLAVDTSGEDNQEDE